MSKYSIEKLKKTDKRLIDCRKCKHSNDSYCKKAEKWAYLMTKKECNDAKYS